MTCVGVWGGGQEGFGGNLRCCTDIFSPKITGIKTSHNLKMSQEKNLQLTMEKRMCNEG